MKNKIGTKVINFIGCNDCPFEVGKVIENYCKYYMRGFLKEEKLISKPIWCKITKIIIEEKIDG